MADKAVQRLVDAGFDRDDIVLVCSDQAKRKHFPDLETTAPAGDDVPERAAVGGAIGAVLGGIGAVSLATASGIGLIGAGAIAIVFGATTGSFVGAMTSRGVEKEVADFCDQALEEGHVLVAARSDDPGRLEEAERAFRELGARFAELPDG
jgi:outer membrane lipoprotein SlyB